MLLRLRMKKKRRACTLSEVGVGCVQRIYLGFAM